VPSRQQVPRTWCSTCKWASSWAPRRIGTEPPEPLARVDCRRGPWDCLRARADLLTPSARRRGGGPGAALEESGGRTWAERR
jgi:hypothetical protein